MYTLKNEALTVSILDPVADAAREGSRYCTGGYIWQVVDAQKGDLLTGPEWPKEPNTFDGQGMPDMFIRALGAEDAPVGGEVGCIGVGRVRRTSQTPFDVRINREVIEFVHWDVTSGAETIQMRTDAAFRDWSYQLTRVVTLAGRTVHSTTAIRNTGAVMLPVRWFAHPFFPLTADNVLCCFSMPVSMPDNPGYFLGEDGYIARKPEFDWARGGWFQPLEFPKTGESMTVIQKYDKIGQVTTVTDFRPAFLPIWGNDRTFSFEPYFEKELTAEQSAQWSIEYRF